MWNEGRRGRGGLGHEANTSRQEASGGKGEETEGIEEKVTEGGKGAGRKGWGVRLDRGGHSDGRDRGNFATERGTRPGNTSTGRTCR